MGNTHWKRWKVVIEDKSGKQHTLEIPAQQLRIDGGCLVFIEDSHVKLAYASDVWASVEREM